MRTIKIEYAVECSNAGSAWKYVLFHRLKLKIEYLKHMNKFAKAYPEYRFRLVKITTTKEVQDV